MKIENIDTPLTSPVHNSLEVSGVLPTIDNPIQRPMSQHYDWLSNLHACRNSPRTLIHTSTTNVRFGIPDFSMIQYMALMMSYGSCPMHLVTVK
jgi:hypothetical protein